MRETVIEREREKQISKDGAVTVRDGNEETKESREIWGKC